MKANRAPACSTCNSMKGDMTPEEFDHFLETGEFLPSYAAHLADQKMRSMFDRLPPALKRRTSAEVEATYRGASLELEEEKRRRIKKRADAAADRALRQKRGT